MFKVYRLDGISGVIALLVLIILLVILAIISLPLLVGAILVLLIYLGYRRFKKSIKKFIENIKKKKIKIEDESQNGDVEIHFAKSVSIDVTNNEYQDRDKGSKAGDAKNNHNGRNNHNNANVNGNKLIYVNNGENGKKSNYVLKDNAELKQFITYLIENGFELKDESLYHGDKLVYPVYKKTYPINEIIRLYEDGNRPDADILVLGLKGDPYNPKFIYMIPINESSERMSIEELRKYMVKI